MKNLLLTFLISSIILSSCIIQKDIIIVFCDPVDDQISLSEGLQRARAFKGENPSGHVEIILNPGSYYLDKSIIIDPVLSNLNLTAALPGSVYIKGSKRLNIHWDKKDTLFYCNLSEHPEITDIQQLYVNDHRQILARYPDYDEDGGHWQGHAPDALSPDRIAGWENPVGTIVHAMHGSEWGDFHYRITGINEDGSAILEGGHQNNRPHRMHTKYRMVENVLEELDSPGEFYFNPTQKILSWYPVNHDCPAESILEIPILKELIIIKGEVEKPVTGIKITGIHFSQSRRTFMEPYEPLLRSDWTIYRGGAVLLDGAEDCEITNCEFTELGGNGIFVSGYNRNHRFTENHIHEIGATGIALVGLSSAVRSPSFQYGQFVPIEEMDTVPGPKTEDYPALCTIDNNLIYRIGRIEKQVSGVQLSMCMDITVSHNSIYDVPRAGINISEGTWGGHILEYNDVFMTVQESGDHGSFNSWGRDRFWHPKRKVLDSLTLADPEMPLWDAIHTTIIRNNRFKCDHGWDIDLDDGSTNYQIYNNLCLNGGIKLREGFYRIVENNIMINNGFHPHVWFSNSSDIFRHNIVMTRHKDIRLDAWGQEVDSNLFPSDEALTRARKNGTDQNSLSGNPDFLAPEQGDFRVSENSPALKIGFQNFDMDQFGVQTPNLKKIRKEPKIPVLFITEFQKKKQKEQTWLGARIKNIETLAERSASGLSEESGVLVFEIQKGGLADVAGLKIGDVILKCEDTEVKTMEDLKQAHQGHNWTGKLSLTVFRNQENVVIEIKTK